MNDAWDQWLERQSEGIDGRIRPLEPRDLDEVLRIIRLHDSDDYRAARQTFEHYEFDGPIADSAFFVLVDRAEPDQEPRPLGVSGYWAGDYEARGIYWLDWTYVNPFVQGRGYGSALLGCVIETLEELEARKLFVATSSLPKYESALAFYRRHDFEREGTLVDYYAPGEDQIILGRPIESG